MKIALLSDIHGNLPALELAIGNLKGVDAFLVLGDVVNYGPWSNECVELLEDLTNCVKLMGNHEGYFLQGECSSQIHLSNLFFDICFQNNHIGCRHNRARALRPDRNRQSREHQTPVFGIRV